jgi:hypothetical protein
MAGAFESRYPTIQRKNDLAIGTNYTAHIVRAVLMARMQNQRTPITSLHFVPASDRTWRVFAHSDHLSSGRDRRHPRAHLPTARGGRWHPSSVRTLLARVARTLIIHRRRDCLRPLTKAYEMSSRFCDRKRERSRTSTTATRRFVDFSVQANDTKV